MRKAPTIFEKNYNETSNPQKKEGVKRLFQRLASNGLRYKFMVCDGDNSVYRDKTTNVSLPSILTY